MAANGALRDSQIWPLAVGRLLGSDLAEVDVHLPNPRRRTLALFSKLFFSRWRPAATEGHVAYLAADCRPRLLDELHPSFDAGPQR